MDWTSLTGLLLTTLAAVLSSMKELRRLSASGTDRNSRRSNLFSRLLITIAIIAGGVGFIGIIHDGKERAANEAQIRDLKTQNQDLLVATLIGQTIKPLIYLFFQKSGQAQSSERFGDERARAEASADKSLIGRSIGFAPSSVREVIFPGADNAQEFTYGYVGEIQVIMPGTSNQLQFSPSGYFDQFANTGGIFFGEKEVANIVALNQADSAFAFNLQLRDDSKAATIYLWLSERYKSAKPLFVVQRYHVSCPVKPPVFDHVQAVYMSKNAPITS
jgi:hypothetical protein